MTSRTRVLRLGATLLAAGALLVSLASPAHATTPPASVTGLAASLGAHGVVLTWTPSGTGPALVRDVTGLPSGYAPGDGRDVPATSGQAYDLAFTNLSTRTYAVWATESDGTPSSQPTELTVSPLPRLSTTTVLDPLPDAVVAGHSLPLAGRVDRAGTPLSGVQVALLSRAAGTTAEVRVATLTSAADGSLQAAYTPVRTRTYRFAFLGDDYSNDSSSATRAVALQPIVSAHVSPAGIQWKRSATLSGTVSPYLPGHVVVVQRWYAGAWHSIAQRTVSAASTWSYVTAPAIGRYSYRAVLPAVVGLRSAVSPAVVLTVVPRTLVSGVSGPDVLRLERRLQALHYDVGRVDGYFDSDLRHAVIAFQKVERLTRTGTWLPLDQVRLAAPKGLPVRYASRAGLVVEINVTRQVLVLHRGTTVLSIVDVSTGSEKTYYQDGVAQVAHTPRGVFRVYHKIDGIRISKLGELYRPSYFYKGWAIHGNGSVPMFPASHGCVRITNHEANRLFTTLAIGTVVAVYDE